AVVDEAQVAEAALLEQLVRLARIDRAAHQMRDVAVAMPRVVVLEATGEVIEQQARRARLLDQVVDRLTVAWRQAASEQRLLAVDHQPGANLVDVRGLAERARDSGDRRGAR